MKTTIVAASLAILFVTPAIASPKIPKQFVGSWCVDSPEYEADDPIRTYERSKKRGCEFTEDSMIVSTNAVAIAGEVACKLLQASPGSKDRVGEYLVRLSCRHMVTKERRIEQFWMIPTTYGRLTTEDLTQEAKK